jgi:hypothetical protein
MTSVAVTSIVTTNVSFGDVVGATVSLIQSCPKGARLSRTLTRSLTATTPKNYRLLSRELWARGVVTRWLAIAPEPDGDEPPLPEQTIACVQKVRADAHGHTAHVTVSIRLWGPTPEKAWLQSFTTGRVVRGRLRVTHSLHVRGFSSQGMDVAGVSAFGTNEIDGSGGIHGPLRSGKHSELRINVAVRAQF